MLTPADSEWVEQWMIEQWAGSFVVSRGKVHYPNRLPGFVAMAEGEPAGLITYQINAGACEIVTIESRVEGIGVGSALIEAVKQAARAAGCRRLWLITTNDNLPALGFYQRRGFELVAVHRAAIETTRRLKPGIPRVGLGGIPIRDEIELEMMLPTDRH
jgi:ribosomal protein S18 acetylase RimI-like enzyme